MYIIGTQLQPSCFGYIKVCSPGPACADWQRRSGGRVASLRVIG